ADIGVLKLLHHRLRLLGFLAFILRLRRRAHMRVPVEKLIQKNISAVDRAAIPAALPPRPRDARSKFSPNGAAIHPRSAIGRPRSGRTWRWRPDRRRDTPRHGRTSGSNW